MSLKVRRASFYVLKEFISWVNCTYRNCKFAYYMGLLKKTFISPLQILKSTSSSFSWEKTDICSSDVYSRFMGGQVSFSSLNLLNKRNVSDDPGNLIMNISLSPTFNSKIINKVLKFTKTCVRLASFLDLHKELNFFLSFVCQNSLKFDNLFS